ncbi:MAG: GNAT family N-acetyltransferase [Arachnia sp.]
MELIWVPHPPRLDHPDRWVLEAEADLTGAMLEEVVGDRDMVTPVPQLWADGSRPHYLEIRHLAATSGGDVLGLGSMELPIADNQHSAVIWANVAAGSRRRGIGTALFEALEATAAREGRSTLLVWADERPPGSGDRLRGTEAGEIDAGSASARFLSGRGYELKLVERISRAEVAPPDRRAADLAEARLRVGSQYELVSWVGATPEPWLDQMAALRVSMSTDAPSGGVDFGAERWDAERVRADDAALRMGDREQITTAARHRSSGDAAGFTRMFVDLSVRSVAHQWETLVTAAHRGHGLGALLKAHNHQLLAETFPEVQRLITGNATQNRWMLAINDHLGYRPYSLEGLYERQTTG